MELSIENHGQIFFIVPLTDETNLESVHVTLTDLILDVPATGLVNARRLQ